MKNFIKKYLGEILLLIGTFLLASGIFDFDYTRGISLKLVTGDSPVAYFYSFYAQARIAFGAVLAALGALIIRKKSD